MIRETRVGIQQKARVCQGDVFRNIECIENVVQQGGILEVSKIIFPLVLVLTQDCDLEQDYRVRWSRRKPANQDKALVSVLVAPLYNEEHVYLGQHLSDLKMNMEPINKGKTPGENLRANNNPRYHFLNVPERIQIVRSVIDFKHYFSVHVEYLKKIKRAHFLCQLADLDRENVSQRFASFLSRIGLPDVPKKKR